MNLYEMLFNSSEEVSAQTYVISYTLTLR